MASLKLAFLCQLCVLLIGTASAAFYKGADISWVSQQEKNGQSFFDSSGTKKDPFVLLKSYGVNAVRLRVWVNPSGGWCDGGDTLHKAQRAKAQGMAIMIDFHYSDSWADPGQQNIPSAWKTHSLAQLNTDVYEHTYGILNYLKSNGISVAWVQVGNEINSGMMWPSGKVTNSNFANLASLTNNGYKASKAVFPNAPVIIHLANGYKTADFTWFFDGLKKAGGSFDVVGISHYPSSSNWQTLNGQAETTLKTMISRYGKKVVVAEIGLSWNEPSASKSMLDDMFKRVKALGNNGIGIFYWEPQASPGWNHYQWGALDDSGKFTAALQSFKNN
ncbi:hypothetical protein niasHT_012078 [Heterodera trifolii]|uniref:arabinogalactan endo-beta-1,4-galactanase n=1 Tax=Heterodera trifolii TaxID=157864 RepID=A0ABD2LA98_9BILA